MHLKKRVILGLAFLLCVLPGCAWQRKMLDRSLYVAQRRGTLRVGLADIGAPFAYEEGGQAAGYAADAAELIARGMGLSVEWVLADRETLSEKLAAYEIDIAIADAVADAAQDRLYHLAGPYFHDPYVVVYPAGREDTDFGSVARIESDPGAEGDVICPTWADALLIVDDEGADAALMPLSAAAGLLHDREGFSVKKDEGEYASYMMVMRLEDAALAGAVDEVMEAVLETGALGDLRSKWYDILSD